MSLVKDKKEGTDKIIPNQQTGWKTHADMSDFFRTLNTIDSSGVSAIITKKEKEKEISNESNRHD